MTAARIGLWGGLAVFAALLLVPAPEGMPVEAWRAAALVVLMATWWMTQALPLTATALLPFLAFPMFGVMSADEAAAAYYSPARSSRSPSNGPASTAASPSPSSAGAARRRQPSFSPS